jgi:hypothetical protein
MLKAASRLSRVLLALSLLTGCAGSATTTAPVVNAPSDSCPAAANPNDGLEKLTDQELAKKILEVTGAAGLMRQMADSMFDSFSKMPNLPPAFLERFRQNLHVEELIELVVPIYLKHYDRSTLIAAIRFYRSDRGALLIKALPAVTAETTEVGKAWGAALAKKTLTDLDRN